MNLLAVAGGHLAAAKAIIGIDLAGAYILGYDAARKAITAHMIHHGQVVANGPGGQRTVGLYGENIDAATFAPFERMRRNRNRSEYGTRTFSESEVVEDLVRSEAMVAVVVELLTTDDD